MIKPEPSSSEPSQGQLVDFIKEGVDGRIKSVSIIGSYLINNSLRPGSDIDTVVVVDNLRETIASFGDKIFYKNTIIEDSQGRRQEVNVKLGNTPVDITIIDPGSTNPPNNPLTDYYENFLGICESGLAIYGQPLREVLNYENLVKEYDKVREYRLKLVDEKILLTERKIVEQGRDDLHIVYELQRYVFIRECIAGRVFNKLSIKRPELSVPGFDEIFSKELGKCGLTMSIKKIGYSQPS